MDIKNILLIIIGAIGTLLTLYTPDEKKKHKIIKLVGVLLITIPTLIFFYYSEEEKKYSSNSGILESQKSIESETYPCVDLLGAKIIQVGGSKTPIFQILDPVTVWIENGSLRMDFTLRDADANIVYRIRDNEWQLPISNGNLFDKNFDDNAFEIIDPRGDVVLQVELVDSCAKIAFITGLGNGMRILFGYGYIHRILPFEDPILKFDPLFKYPSNRYKGQREPLLNSRDYFYKAMQIKSENEFYFLYSIYKSIELDENNNDAYLELLKYFQINSGNDFYFMAKKYSKSKHNDKFLSNLFLAEAQMQREPDSALFYLNACFQLNPEYQLGYLYFLKAKYSYFKNIDLGNENLENALKRGLVPDLRLNQYSFLNFINNSETKKLLNKYGIASYTMDQLNSYMISKVNYRRIQFGHMGSPYYINRPLEIN